MREPRNTPTRKPGRQPRPLTGPLARQRIELDVDDVAAGGQCVGRHEGRVIFVRHALPGERVVALITEDRGGTFCRADAVEILRPSPDRVAPPCPHAGPGKCGGCDWQHATPAAQRDLKAAVVREALRRIGGFAPETPVIAGFTVAAADPDALGWRTRAQFAVDRTGRIGLHRHRSHAVQPVTDCPLVVPEVRAAIADRRFPGGATVEVTAAGDGTTDVDVRRGRRPTGDRRILHEQGAGRSWQVHAGGFWQVHPAAVDTLVGCVLDLLAPRPGDRVLDLYAGVGVFAGAMVDRIGATGTVTAVESDPVAAADAALNVPSASVIASAVDEALPSLDPADLVVLDPPRSGAGAAVMTGLFATGARAIAYVACDPAALARDLKIAAEAGWELQALRGFDLFPMTHHVECVALLVEAAAG